MSKRSVEAALAELSALAGGPAGPHAVEQLRNALAQRSSLVAAKAADVAARLRLEQLAPELTQAFDRFLSAPAQDKGCLAKSAIARTLYELGETSGETVFLRGIRHVQMEGSYGGAVDVAPELRGICGMGLVRIGSPRMLIELTDLLADPEPQARCSATRALAYSGREEAALLLRLKLLLGDREIDVMAECMSALVSLRAGGAIQVVGRFLDHADSGIRAAAALALGETRDGAALEPLRRRLPREPAGEVVRSILVAAAGLRAPESLDWLVELIGKARPRDAALAIEAAAIYRRDPAVRARTEQAIAARQDPALRRMMDKHLGAPIA